ncbi:MAG TPA: Pycsar system effector family protein, partial [Candidatus Paceibacterota bacterium]|nr:Pycsar system effector family protein [Candidatus Paceibacterota bacterium]
MEYKTLLIKVEQYATDSILHTDLDRLPYHNLKHTQYVVSYSMQLTHHYQLSERDSFVVVASAWLHDLGYLIERENHEAEGATAAGIYLSNLDVAAADIESIKGCILATKLPQNPHNLLEEIVCDADLSHLGKSDFDELSKLMRKEMEGVYHKRIDKGEWRNQTINLFESHKYHTDYARMQLDEEKQKNLRKLKEKSGKKFQNSQQSAESLILPEKMDENEHTEKRHSKDQSEKPERGIETMFRISATNHLRLSNMADNKAHIMVTVNSIILSAIISLLLRKLDNSSYLMIPSFMLLISSVSTIVFAILATRPAIPTGFFSKKEIDEKKVNLLFFGNFYRMPLSDYREG